MTFPQWLSIATLTGMMVLFLWGRFRYDVTAVIALLTAIAIGIVKPKEAFSGFSDDIVIIVGSALVMAREKLSFALPAYFGIPETFDLAADWGSPVMADYRAGTPFPGKLIDVTFDFNGRGGGELKVH